MHCIDFEISGGAKIILEKKNYANEIESKGVPFPGRGAPDKVKRGG